MTSTEVTLLGCFCQKVLSHLETESYTAARLEDDQAGDAFSSVLPSNGRVSRWSDVLRGQGVSHHAGQSVQSYKQRTNIGEILTYLTLQSKCLLHRASAEKHRNRVSKLPQKKATTALMNSVRPVHVAMLICLSLLTACSAQFAHIVDSVQGRSLT